ncbi:MAG: hypothetical protein M1815_002166 [Lichina confinis]|nr:MAG: hypothetical protein M1815_002166 [Lichina confinis]
MSTAWDCMDTCKLTSEFKRRLGGGTPALHTTTDIDNRVEHIVEAIRAAIEQATPWVIPSPRVQPGWTAECQEAIHTTKTARKWWQRTRASWDWAEYRWVENNKAWKIKKATMAGFRNAVWELTEKPVGLWKMAK